MAKLERRLTTFVLALYGVGVMVGAGIYVLIGKVAEVSGHLTWVAMAAAAVVALPTGLAYAELSSRYPLSAGEAVFVDRAFGQRGLSFTMGLVILSSGVTSVATVSHGFAEYARALMGAAHPWTPAIMVVGFIVALSWVNHRGLREATWLNVVCTTVSVAGLIVIIAAASPLLLSDGLVDMAVPSPAAASLDGTGNGWVGAIVAGAALSFYAYIGFEDICNVAEEVRSPHTAIPRAIILSLAVTAVLYCAVALAATSVVAPAELADAEAPLALVVKRLFPGLPSAWLSAIALFAITNTALFNLIMGSRILYGLGRDDLLPARFAYVHPRRKTPTWGVGVMCGLVLLVALTGLLKVLAETTSTLILSAFFLINAALLVIRWRKIPPDDPQAPYFRAPMAAPIIGIPTTAYLLAQFSTGAYVRAAILLLLGFALYGVHRRTKPAISR